MSCYIWLSPYYHDMPYLVVPSVVVVVKLKTEFCMDRPGKKDVTLIDQKMCGSSDWPETWLSLYCLGNEIVT